MDYEKLRNLPSAVIMAYVYSVDGQIVLKKSINFSPNVEIMVEFMHKCGDSSHL